MLQAVKQNIFSLFEIEGNSRKLVACIRILSLVFIVFYVLFFFKYAFNWYAYTTLSFFWALTVYSGIGAVCNFGLFFITTKKAKEMKIFSTLCYIPTVLITPIMVIYALRTPWGIPIAFLGSIVVYCRFNPWRNNV